MGREIGRWRALLSATFALGVLAIGGFGLYHLAGRRWRIQPTFPVRAKFQSVGGIEAGGKVRLQGIEAGTVERIVPPSEPGQPVELVLRVDSRLRPLVRSDATARILSQGFVGLKVVEIVPGLPSAPPVDDSTLIRSEEPLDPYELLARARTSLDRLDVSVAEAGKGIAQLRSIADAVAKGEGSLGKLIRDETLFNQLVSLSKRGEQTVGVLQENLDAVKHTWPISRYFDNRAYFDRNRLLFQPGSARVSRSLVADEMFEPGRSVLTEQGKRQLDEIGRWFKSASGPTSEVVIAAFTDLDGDEGRSQILTQEQANAVRSYLVSKHAIDSAGWFRSRKVAAVGFGSRTPDIADDRGHDGSAPRRIDVIIFTPQA